MTGFFAAVVEAWGEFKVHKTRVLLSLIGVALSVAALSTVVGMGDLARESIQQSQERSGGRSATVSAYISPGPGVTMTSSRQKFIAVMKQYQLEYFSTEQQFQLSFQFPNGVQQAQASAVDPAYGVIHRLKLFKGHWFAPDDAQRLAPALVVNQTFYQSIGSPNLNTDPEISATGEKGTSMIIIGVLPNQYGPLEPASAYLLPEAAASLGVGALDAGFNAQIWSQVGQADQLTASLRGDLQSAFPAAQVSVNRSDYAAMGDPYLQIELVVGAIAGVVMFLGILSLLNISMVTIKHRVREIGIRRSFGATGARVFFGVLMESVVATTIAGILGVMLAIAIVKNPQLESFIGPGIADYPPFPISAALIGLASAVLAGALAGALPALVAVRVKVIDAIRF
ncbi:putative ABC transport system permease protein [Psychromicrobium silvestre]|uniref:Putative ABC transport system permease protein n=1 Tax=Psychromicrobium silvestre TaxID=1645614 RepID=A0A7Y9LVM5_9MICC|nr:ABC transporter permease [Psychromicrobium silvestre]NYE96443.1 putative ABC transport system permease protein [Psychromicrobium silvestre]